ncbi:MAG: YifB family Mg chelatase-like AAA ATPase [Pseudomonadota bacterium]
MSLTQIKTRAQLGIEAPVVTVEVHISNGLPAFTLVGLAETAVREARDRVRSAIINSGFEFPAKRITVNLAPADLPKVGGSYDLPIALGILSASAQIDGRGLENRLCFGELALSGDCRRIEALLPALLACRQQGQTAIVPADNQIEAALSQPTATYLASRLVQICDSLNGGEPLPLVQNRSNFPSPDFEVDFQDVRGQAQAKRAMEIAATGAHHLLMMGPPGCGKSMLAQRLNTILPPMSEEEATTAASIRSVSQQPVTLENWYQRPFRSPHHTVSPVALAGGGSHPKPGEISLAHHGVLFLDELLEFNRGSLEVLREPLETGKIHISRASRQVVFPASFQLIAAMNPCPGGCPSIRQCDCVVSQLTRYRNKLSAPLMDRIDIQLELQPLPHEALLNPGIRENGEEPGSVIRDRVSRARNIQIARQGCYNAGLDHKSMQAVCDIDSDSHSLLHRAGTKLGLTARSIHKIMKLGRTIADLDGARNIQSNHIAEAVSYRHLDKRKINTI